MAQPSPRPVTIRDLAREAGVNHATVSRALRDDPVISPATRRRIKALAARRHYRPDPILSALMVYRSGRLPVKTDRGLIAVLDPCCAVSSHTLVRELVGIRSQARSLGYEVEVFSVDPADSAAQKRLARVLYARGIRGLLAGPMPPGHAALPGFDWAPFSAVALGYSLKTPQLHFVAQDHDARCQMVYRRLREMGCRRIGYCNRHAIEQNNRHLMLGAYLKSLYLDGLSPDALPPLLYTNYADLAPLAWLRRHRFDAVITGMTNEFHVRLDSLRVPRSQRPYLAGIVLPADIEPEKNLRWPGGIEDLSLVGTAAVNLLHQLMCQGHRGIPAQRQSVIIEGRWNPGTRPFKAPTNRAGNPARKSPRSTPR